MTVSFSFKLNCEVISVGVFLLNNFPSPSWPLLFEPHMKTRPVDVSADEWLEPNDTNMIVSSWSRANLDVISIGISLSVLVPSPSWPPTL